MKKNVSFNISVFTSLFVNRSDTYCEQQGDKSYRRIEKTLGEEDVRRHLEGEATIGTYLLDKDSMVKVLVFDLDHNHVESIEEATKNIVHECLKRFNPRESVLLEASRYPDSSFHVWVFFITPIPAKVVRWLGRQILKHAQLSPNHIEVFPKQDELTVENPFGNLVKLPLGFHRHAEKWSRFLDPETFKPLPNECLNNVLETTLFETDIQRIMGSKEKKTIKAKHGLPKKFKALSSLEEEKIVRFLCRYWVRGYRDELEFCWLGWASKRGICHESAYRIIGEVTCRMGDEEGSNRLRLVDYHYRKRMRNVPRLKGISGLRDLVEEINKKWRL